MATPRILISARSRREALGITREQLAQQAQVSTSTITRLETGHIPKALPLARIAAALGCGIDELLTEAAS